MPKLVVQEREYEWPDPSSITYRESQTVKDHLGVSVIDLLQNLYRGSVDEQTLLAMFIVAKIRADGSVDMEKILDLPILGIEVKDDEPKESDDSDAEAPLVDLKEPSASKPRRKSTKAATAG